MSGKPYQDAETLRKLYHEEDMTAAQIGDRFGVSQATISRWLSRNEIETRSSAESRDLRGTNHRPTKDGPHTSAEWLRKRYLEDHWSVTEMSEEASVTEATILRNMDKHGIERRPQHVTRVLRDPGAGFVHADSRGYETIKHSVDDHTYNFPIHRLLAIAEYGYDAVDGSVVHHKNGIKWDNRHENIELLETQSDHASHHHAERERDELGRYA